MAESIKISDMEVFSMQGHGCDTGETLTVPKGCVYVTLTYCETETKLVYIHRIKFIELFNKSHPHHHWLQDPIKHMDDLRSFGLDVHIHCHEKGFDPTYTDCVYSLFMGFSGVNAVAPGGYHVLPSGMYPLGKDLTLAECPFPTHTINHPFGHLPVNVITCDTDTVSQDILEYIYRDSLYPTIEQVNDFLTTRETTFNVLETMGFIRQSILFEHYPGIHYNVSCRTICPGAQPEKLKLRKQHSYQQNVDELLFPGYKPLSPTQLKHAVDMYCDVNGIGYAAIGTWDVSQIKHMDNLFQDKTDFNEDLSEWDVSNVVSMMDTFTNTPHFNQSLKDWNPKKLSRFKVVNSQLNELFQLPETLVELTVINCPITRLNMLDLSKKLYIRLANVRLDQSTLKQIVYYYTHESSLSEEAKRSYLSYYQEGKMKKSRRKHVSRKKRHRLKTRRADTK